MNISLNHCKDIIENMLKKSQTKVIFPIITLALIREYNYSRKYKFTNIDVGKAYIKTVKDLAIFLKHNLHIGGKYYDAYPIRNLTKYGVVGFSANYFVLQKEFRENAIYLEKWIPSAIKKYIKGKLGIIPELGNSSFRLNLSNDLDSFINFIKSYFTTNSTNFEIFSFAIIKVHLEKFACKIYRDTRTSATDQGVDLSTNFGAVYQIKKMKIFNKQKANEIYSEIKLNIDEERMNDGKVIIVIDDISKEIKNYLINMKIQSLCKDDIIKLALQFEEPEERIKFLRIIFEEFRRDYESQI